MNTATRQFVRLLLEKEEEQASEDKPKRESENQKKKRRRAEQEEKSQKSQSENRKLLKTATDNSLSKGRPISDAGLANMKYRSNGTPAEAKEMLDELGITKASGSDWSGSIASIFDSASKGKMSALIAGAELVKSSKNQPGVELKLKSQWKQDDKGGKRSFGFIRAIIAASNKAGYLSVGSTVVKNLRVEQVQGEDSFIIYVGRKATSWGV